MIAAMLNRALWNRRGGRVQASLGVLIWEPGIGATTATYGSVMVKRSAAAEIGAAMPAKAAGLSLQAQPTMSVDCRPPAWPLVMCSDGIAASIEALGTLVANTSANPLTASVVLERAMARDEGRPRNDMSVIVMSQSLVDNPGSATNGELRMIVRSRPTAREMGDAQSAN